MTASTPTVRQQLEALGIQNGRQLADHVQAPAAIFFLLTKDGHGKEDLHAELHYTEHGTAHVETFRPGPLAVQSGRISRKRTDCVQQAKDWAAHELKISSWRRTVFPSCWLPTESIERIQRELGPDDH